MNETCSNKVKHINSKTWQDYIDAGVGEDQTMDDSTLCGVSSAVSSYPLPDKSFLANYKAATSEVESLSYQLTQELEKISNEEKTELANMGINVKHLDKQIKGYNELKKDYLKTVYKQEKMKASTIETTDFLTHTNYMYSIAGIIAIVLIIATSRISKK